MLDVAPQGVSLKYMADVMAKEMARTKIELLWGTANLTGHPRYLAGAATNPDPKFSLMPYIKSKKPWM